MSCLSLDELPLSEQAAVAASFTAACERKYAALRTSLWLSPGSLGLPPVPSDKASSRAVVPGDGHIPLFHTEDASMVEKQLKELKDHPRLQVCFPGHRPHMYRASGNCKVEFYVECSACMVRGQRAATPDLAATAWARRFVESIRGIADHATVAA
jgi:hypothetical protein